MPAIFFDVAIVALLALFLWMGARKGFVLSLFGLVAIVVAFIGASFLAQSLSPKVGAALEPKFAAIIEEKLEEQFHSADAPALPEGADAAEGEYPLQAVLEVLKSMGLYEDLINAVDDAVQNGMSQVAANAAAAVAAAIAQSIAYMLIFLIAFVLILIGWGILSHALDLVAKLPVLNTVNKLGGAAIGLVKGCIILFVLAWLLRVSGTLIPEETVAQTTLLKFFLTTNPVKLITGV